MLVLSRKVGEKIIIDRNILVTVIEVNGNKVRLAFEAPDDVRILRHEITIKQQPSSGGARPLQSQPV
jgi:carbon storage regulator